MCVWHLLVSEGERETLSVSSSEPEISENRSWAQGRLVPGLERTEG